MYGNVKKIPLKLKSQETNSKLKSTTAGKRKLDEISVQDIRGRVLASGTSVTGLNTFFKEDVLIGDVLVIVNPQTHVVEERVVTDILANRNLVVHAKFSSDFVSTVESRVRKEGLKLREQAELESQSVVDTEREKFMKEFIKKRIAENTAESSAVVFTEKRGRHGYTTRVEEVKGKLSKEEELNLRAKRVHDKFC